MIRIDHVTKKYEKKEKDRRYEITALDDIDITIEDGEFVFIVGKSGAGKSSLFKLLSKEIEPTSGEITINNYVLGKLPRRRIPYLRRTVGVVYQNFNLLTDWTVYENVALAQRVIGVPDAQIKKNVSDILSLCGIAGKYRAKPNELSGGEKQRVAVARTLVNKPKIILADEPTGNLDSGNAEIIMNLLERANAQGTTVVVVTHNLEIVNKMKKRVITLKKGCIESDVPAGGVLV